MPFLKDFVYRAGAGLEQEDRNIIGSSLIHNQRGGLLRVQQERFWQYIIWKSVYSNWEIEVEKVFGDHQYDFAKIAQPGGNYDCFFELKKWLSEYGEAEIQGICDDIVRLNLENLNNSVLILLANNRRGDMNRQILWLVNRVNEICGFTLDEVRRESFCFNTISPNDHEHHEFWISAWPIRIGHLLEQ
ncbi:MAG: hypothetical protein LGL72_00075 [Acidibrevibacterium sp.]|jgi:hypothetical protein|uniref:hypothetical protein n=1 Tax=Acidibrevibacterium fodinaquatile TaxID=1969806 RepID=UPI0023A89F1E|nr:hypothetical protein [Acidibrevibacterium fodinaquatile]MCA7117841.1 hypothetical protein [Acidibrevibacterium fodinaquatile]